MAQHIRIFKDDLFGNPATFATDKCNAFLAEQGGNINILSVNSSAFEIRDQYTAKQGIFNSITLCYDDNINAVPQQGRQTLSQVIANDPFSQFVINMTNFFFSLTNKTDTIMITQSELAQRLNDLAEQGAKTKTEINQRLNDLETQIKSSGSDVVTPELQAAFDKLKITVQQLDDIIPDSATTPPVDVPPVDVPPTDVPPVDVPPIDTTGSVPIVDDNGNPIQDDNGSTIVTGDGTDGSITTP